MSSVLVVHLERDVRENIVSALASPDFDVVAAHSALVMFKYLWLKPPDVLVVADCVEGLDVYVICRQLRESSRFAHMMMILVSEKEEPEAEDIARALDAGADDCVGARFAGAELAARVRALIRRARQPNGEAPSYGSLEMVDGLPCVRVEGRSVWLTATEARVMTSLVQAGGNVVQVSKLLEDVWDQPPGPGKSALVRAYIRSLRQKIELEPSQPVYIRTVRGRGYRLSVPMGGAALGDA